MEKKYLSGRLNNQQGVSAVIIAICIFMLVGFVALAIDVGHLYVARNELQNAADAGALAGARHLYLEDGKAVNPNANQVAYEAAIANVSENKSVEVNDYMSNTGDVQRGHWSFTTRTFTPNDSLAAVPIWQYSRDELDSMPEFINAVRVITHRGHPQSLISTPVESFFARIFGLTGFRASRPAVAYIGFAGSTKTDIFDQPIAICAEAIIEDEECFENNNCDMTTLKCNEGRMLDSSNPQNDPNASNNTAAWTNFEQSYCDTADANQMKDLVCDPQAGGIPETINFDQPMGATGGVQQVTLDKLRECWLLATSSYCDDPENETGCQPVDGSITGDGLAEYGWGMTLPVVRCPGNNVSNCPTVVGVVEVTVAHITNAGTPDPSQETPFEMSIMQEKPIDNDPTQTEFVADSWSVNSDSPPDLVGLDFSVLATLHGFDDKYFQPQTTECNTEGGTPQGPIPAPVSNGGVPSTITINEVSFTIPYQLDQDFLKIKDPEPVPPAYDPQNICFPHELEDAFRQRQADAAGMARWVSFVEHFGLKNYQGDPAPLRKKSIYYLPGCYAIDPTGDSQGMNFGVLAEIPVLVD